MSGREIAVVELGRRFLVVDRHLWDVEKTSGDTILVARSGVISVHETREEAEAACSKVIANLPD